MTVINHQYRYLFVHVPKAAGKSVKQHLLNNTFSAPERAALRLSFRIESLCNYAAGFGALRPLIPVLHGPAIDARLRQYCDHKRYYTTAHLRAEELREALGDDYGQLFSFGFVRNPWDRCLSAYFYFQRKPLHPLHQRAMKRPFSEFLREQQDTGMPFVGQQSWWLFQDHGEQLVDFIGKVEQIQEDMAKISERLGLPARGFSTRTNVSQARERDYRRYYDTTAVDVVSQMMHSDIDRLNYQFDGVQLDGVA